jgi:hypothetical protein
VEDNCIHISLHEQNELLDLLTDFEDLFDGTLGDWNTEPVSFELSAKGTQRSTNKRTVLKAEGASEWASPSFIIPKKDMTVRFISDFREVNKRIKRKPFPIPKISTVLQEMEGYTFATALDLNMGYYT